VALSMQGVSHESLGPIFRNRGGFRADRGGGTTRAAAEDKAKAAPVEFTADGKLKQPVGYRKWVYVSEVVTPNDMNDGEAAFPESNIMDQ